jgi:hypothetical protein
MVNIRREVEHMKIGFALKAWVYFLCVSFLLLTSGFHTMVAEAKEIGRPLGDMLSPGDAMFESRGGVWKNVEVFEFPIFPGVRMKTVESPSLVTLQGNRQIDVGENSLFSFDRNDQMELTQGSIEFRLPLTTELSFNVGELTVTSKPLEVTIGSISVHSNGAVTIKCYEGSLSVLNQERVVLAALSSEDKVTLPSVIVKGPKVMVAQGDEKTSDSDDEGRRFLGIPWWIWAVGGVVIAAAIITIAVTSGGGHGGSRGPVCP